MMEVCFACGKEFFSLATPMRCAECVRNKIPIQTSPVRNSDWVLTSVLSQLENDTNSCQAGQKKNSENNEVS